jgi:hypothetical protein
MSVYRDLGVSAVTRPVADASPDDRGTRNQQAHLGEDAGSAHRPEVRPDARGPEVPPELVRRLAS